MKDLLSIAKQACDVAVRAGAEFVDVSAQRGKYVRVELEKCAIKSSDVRWAGGISIRAFVKGGMGFASTDSVKEEDIVQTAENAAALARAAEPDPDFVSLPAPAPYPPVEGLFDEKIAEMGVNQIVEYAAMNIDAARSVVEDVIVSGGAGCGFSESALVNSLGVEATSKSSSIGISIFAIIKRGDDVGSFFEFDQGRRLYDFEPEGLGAKAAEEARRFLDARKIETATLPVVLGPLTSSRLFSTLLWNANAEDIQRNRSYLVGMKGKQVASDLLTIVDDGLYPAGMSSGPFDGEGFPRRRLVVVENGILQSTLHNSYTANKAKEENTGHATRGGIGPTNVRPKPGDVPSEEIIKDTQEGLYINMGGVFPNPVTGEISGSVDFGFKIENGELAYPVKNTMIGINMLEMMRNIDAVSSDYREEPGEIMLTIRVQGVKVASGK